SAARSGDALGRAGGAGDAGLSAGRRGVDREARHATLNSRGWELGASRHEGARRFSSRGPGWGLGARRHEGDRRPLALLAADSHLGARCDEIAVDVAERDRALQRRRDRAAGDLADLTTARDDAGPVRWWRFIALYDDPHQLPGNPAVTTVEDADDHLLADVAALREAERARFHARLERDCLLVHIAMKSRNAGLDPQRLGRAVVQLRHIGRRKRRPQRLDLSAIDVHVEARFAGLGDARHDRGATAPLDAKVAVLRQ